MSHLLLQLYPLTVSINSNILTIHSFLSSFPLRFYLAVSAASSGVSLYFTAGSFTMVWFAIHLKLRQFALAPAHDSNWFQILAPIEVAARGYICFTVRLRQASWCHFWLLDVNFVQHIFYVCSSFYFYIRALCHIRPSLDSRRLATLVHSFLYNTDRHYMSSLLRSYTPLRQFRSASLNVLSLPSINIAVASRSLRHAGPSLWNSLPHIQIYGLFYLSIYRLSFNSDLKTHLFSGAGISGP